MRVTVDLDEVVLGRAKELALNEHRTLGGVVGDALAAYLEAKRGRDHDPVFELLVRGRPQARFPTPAEIDAVEDA